MGAATRLGGDLRVGGVGRDFSFRGRRSGAPLPSDAGRERKGVRAFCRGDVVELRSSGGRCERGRLGRVGVALRGVVLRFFRVDGGRLGPFRGRALLRFDERLERLRRFVRRATLALSVGGAAFNALKRDVNKRKRRKKKPVAASERLRRVSRFLGSERRATALTEGPSRVNFRRFSLSAFRNFGDKRFVERRPTGVGFVRKSRYKFEDAFDFRL